MLIAIAGSQGCGKSTTVSELKRLGFNTIERKTSRSILQDWGVTLQEVNNTPELTVKFQEEISKRKYDDEVHGIQSPDLWFTERTHSDLFTYSLVSLGKDNQHSDWLNGYYTLCQQYNQQYAHVFYLRAGHFDIEHDGVRGSNKHYSKMVDLVMLDFTKQMVHNSNLTIIDTPNLNLRVSTILEISSTLHNN
jgi:energy-coupling factor transporter ATP-binding protein EcfA2